MTAPLIPFNRPYMTGKEINYIAQAHANARLSGDGPFTALCNAWLQSQIGCARALLTHSCTSALEMAALLLDIGPGDEVIMPSFTFVSTANAFVLRGAVPVFVDIRADTLNLDERLIESAITPRTRVIVSVHYAGVGCEMDAMLSLAARYGIDVVEDAAQAIMASYKGRPLGSFGALGALSFHETKNIISGEGGSLLINRPELAARAEIIREKGTNRSSFNRGEVDKYTWLDVGSSFLPGEIVAAFLWAQMEEAQNITARRLAAWQLYHELLEHLEIEGLLRRPEIPNYCTHNAHMYFVLIQQDVSRDRVLDRMRQNGVWSIFHYVPLHSSPAGLRFGRISGELTVTTSAALRLIRLPLWIGIDEQQQVRVVAELRDALRQATAKNS